MPPTICVQCKHPCRGHFEITRYDPQNVAKGSVKICSAVCLIRWTADFSAAHGAAAVNSVRNLIAQLATAVKGS